MARGTFNLSRDTSPFTSERGVIREILGVLDGFRTHLDIGCGPRSPVRFVTSDNLVGVDAFSPDLERARSGQTHDDFVTADCRELNRHFTENQFEVCIAKDVIEHLSREDGLALLRDMERIASRRIVIFTPNGWLEQDHREEGDLQEHLSGWSAQDMRDLGFRVSGLLGPKALRTERHQIRFQPRVLWLLISMLLQRAWCRRHPDSAAAILCWKDLPAG